MGTKSASFLARTAFFCGILALLTHGVCLVSILSPDRSLLWAGLVGFVCATVAFVLGHVIRSDPGRRSLSNSTFSLGTAGQYLGGAWFIITFLILAFVPIPQGPTIRVKQARTLSDMRNLAAALEAYHQDHEIYPPAVDESGILILLPEEGISGVSAGYVPWLLTTPLAYLSELPSDLFHRSLDRKEMPFRYATNGAGCWILASNGPDEEINVKVSGFPSPEIGDCSEERFMSHSDAGKVVAYDASNGTISSGDIIRAGP